MSMEIENNYYDSLLDDPVENQEPQIEEPVVEEAPLLPDQPSDEPTQTESESTEPEQTEPVEDDLITSYLKSKGISDPTKIQFENEDGGIDEVDFKTLSKDEQLTMLQELASTEYTDYESTILLSGF